MMNDARRAQQLYIESLAVGSASTDWHAANVDARKAVISALRDSGYLSNVASAIMQNGGHLKTFRHMLAPPVSQDQFALVCSQYNKGCEKPGRVVSAIDAPYVAAAIAKLLDAKLTRWLGRGRKPSTREVRVLAAAVSPMLSQQGVATLRRGRLSAVQEGEIVAMLTRLNWTQIRSGTVDQSSALPARHFMHKTRFATQTRPQEVDVACGLGKSVILAMECKVTNDQTNSVKRINDVLKKATAWQAHWGSFVRTAALLQGVIAERDVARLEAAHVHVFWSHDLAKFESWLIAEVSQ